MAKILAIDDSLTIRKLVDMILRGAGHEVLLAETGAAGLALAKEKIPDLILLDYILPDIQSPEICKQLLENPATAGLPVLLISTNGAAIRQLYSDSRNVRDYLTKPFQAKVLQSVVEHLLGKRTTEVVTPEGVEGVLPTEPAAPAVTGGSRSPTLPLPPVPAVPAQPATKSEPAVPPVGGAARFGPGVGSALANDGHAGLRTLLNARFRNIAKMIPDLETRRGALAPETYYLPFLLRNELVSEIVAEVSRTQIASLEYAAPLIAGTHEWMGIDTTFFHLGRTSASGVFSFKLQGETVDVTLSQGRVVMVGSNNPRVYCAGAAYNFRSVPAPAIASAVAAQQRDGTPFFVTLCRLGILRDIAGVSALLRAQGVRAVHRAMTTPGTRYAFVPRPSVSEVARQFSLNLDVKQFVLEVLRRIDDWLEIESTTGSVDTIYELSPTGAVVPGQLSLLPEESAVLAAINGQRTLHALAASSGVDLFGTCAIVYRLLKLGAVRVGVGLPQPPATYSDPSVEEFLQETAWDPSAEPPAVGHLP